MTSLIIRTVENKREWERFLLSRPEANFLQSWDWGEMHKNLKKLIFRRGFYIKKGLAGVMLSVVEDAKRAKYLTVPGGPIIDWENDDLVDAAFKEMKGQAVKTKSVFVRVRPQLLESEEGAVLFRKYGFKKSLMHLHAELSNVLDISKSEEELLSQMRKTTRYEIRKAEREGIKIVRSMDERLIRDFYELQLVTAKRQKFVPFSYDFFLEQFKIFFTARNGLIYTAYLEDKVLAQAFIIFYGQEAVYHYGASTDEGRKHPGAYLIQWEAIKEARRRGMKRYNFWGVAPEEERDHRFYGVSVFKRGFGGEDVAYLHARDLVVDERRYLLNLMIEGVRKKLRRV
jgi:lipid II:glycine glycyltransferase (peptidoglycan interpeptide bridge formation enzyme)